ncbi:MAG: hypothetical protein AAB341_00690 [Planctomycetota bacterium]
MSDGEPITKYPVCRYDLTGLPKDHTCPECGFEYDETMRLWRPSSTRIAGFRVVVAGVWMYLAFRLTVDLFLWAIKPSVIDWRDMAEWFGWLFVATYFLVFPRIPRFVIVGDCGLVYKFRLTPVCKVPWSAVALVEDPRRPFRIRKRSRHSALPSVDGLSEARQDELHAYMRHCFMENVARLLAEDDQVD